jgi:hypothetical protein
VNGLVAGIGDVLLRYPELLETVRADDLAAIEGMRPYVAVHLGGSAPEKIPPHPTRLVDTLRASRVNYVLVGPEYRQGLGGLRTQMEVVKLATKFIGTLSCFNVVAQLAKVPSFVLVNRSLKEPFVYNLMDNNKAIVEAWNVGKSWDRICDEAAEWAKRECVS